MDVELFTRDGHFVSKETIPPFLEPPSLLVWGLRFFVHSQDRKYYEAFTYAIPPQHPGSETTDPNTPELPFDSKP